MSGVAQKISETEDHFSVPDDLVPYVPQYLDRREIDIERLRDFIAISDFESISRIGHKLRGSGTGYGFQVITQIGTDLEIAATTRNESAIRDLIAYLNDVVEDIRDRFVE